MKGYEISILPEAMQDIDDLYVYIAFQVMMPLAAIRYYNGIVDTINALARFPESHAVSEINSVQRRYGPGARTVCYKKMTVIYNIVGNTVIIRRVTAGNLLY
jgi:plasmid stabilization system protein ParE